MKFCVIRLLCLNKAMDIKPGPQHKKDTNKPILVAAFDVDNTLLPDGSGQPPSRAFTEAAVEAAQKGIAISIVSARGVNKVLPTLIKPLLEAGVPPELIRWHGLANGAQIYDGVAHKIVQEHLIPIDIAQQLMSYLQARGIEHWVNDSDGLDCRDYFWAQDNTYATVRDQWAEPSADNSVDVPGYVPNKPLVLVANDVPAADYQELLKMAEEFAPAQVVSLLYQDIERGGQHFYKVFFLHALANKGAAAAALSTLYDAPLDQFLVMGDGTVDEPMLAVVAEAGGLAMAVANAVPGTLAAATHIAPAQVDDGAAVGLRYALQNAQPEVA